MGLVKDLGTHGAEPAPFVKPKQEVDKPKYSAIIRDRKWYWTLLPGPSGRSLMNDYSLDNLAFKHVISLQQEDQRLFTVFNDFIDLYKYQEKLEPCTRALYELIFGDFPQKPHFDIDISDSNVDLDVLGAKVLETLCCAIRSVHVFDIEKDLLIYSSHSSTKRSFHVVINNWKHRNNINAKAFYQEVINRIGDEDVIRYIDHAVYSSKQQFRLLHSQKWNSNRPKIFHEKFTILGKTYQHQWKQFLPRHYEEFADSLVGLTADCQFLPDYYVDRISPNLYTNDSDLNDHQIERAIALMNQAMDPVFEIDKITPPFISLRRCEPSMCPICKRIHESQNPYILVSNRTFLWSCRRSEMFYVLGEDVSPIIQEEIVEYPVGFVPLEPDSNNSRSIASSVNDQPDYPVAQAGSLVPAPKIDIMELMAPPPVADPSYNPILECSKVITDLKKPQREKAELPSSVSGLKAVKAPKRDTHFPKVSSSTEYRVAVTPELPDMSDSSPLPDFCKRHNSNRSAAPVLPNFARHNKVVATPKSRSALPVGVDRTEVLPPKLKPVLPIG